MIKLTMWAFFAATASSASVPGGAAQVGPFETEEMCKAAKATVSGKISAWQVIRSTDCFEITIVVKP